MEIYIYIYIDLHRKKNRNKNKKNDASYMDVSDNDESQRSGDSNVDDESKPENTEDDDDDESKPEDTESEYEDTEENEEDKSGDDEEDEAGDEEDDQNDEELLAELDALGSEDSSSSSDDPIILNKGNETGIQQRMRINEERQRKRGMYRSSLEPKDKSNTPPGRQCIREKLIRHKIINHKHFPYFDVFETFASKRVSIKNKKRKLSCKCHIGVMKNEECKVYSNGSVIIAVGAKDHFDIIHAPRPRCKKHKSKMRIFHYAKDEQKLYLGRGDEVVWSDGGQYEFYTLVPFTENQTYYKAHNQFSFRYNVDSVLLTVMLFHIIIIIMVYLLIFVNICSYYL